jgi:hypothetical protein
LCLGQALFRRTVRAQFAARQIAEADAMPAHDVLGD